jgi:hypothetical protein
VADPLEGELDRLFQLPPGELVEARNALADRLRRAGDKAGAAQVKAIKRAAPVAWALNQVHFTQPALLAQAREHTEELRGLQTQRGVDPRRLAAAVEQQRSAAQAVIDAALRAGRGAGLSENALSQRKLFTTLQAWLSGKGDEQPGRMTQELEASGFDAFAGMALVQAPAVAAPVAVASPDEREAQPARREPDRAAIERAAQRVAEREQLAVAARQRVGAARDQQAAARQARDQAQAAVREAERRAAELRTLFDQRELELQRCSAALDEAERELAQADQASATSRDELAAISESS